MSISLRTTEGGTAIMEGRKKDNAGRRQRTVYHDYQIKALVMAYEESDGYPDTYTMGGLSNKLGLSQHSVKIWFQNKRARERNIDKQRSKMTAGQENSLLQVFEESDGNPSAAVLDKLSLELNIPSTYVKIWFGKKREYMKNRTVGTIANRGKTSDAPIASVPNNNPLEDNPSSSDSKETGQLNTFLLGNNRPIANAKGRTQVLEYSKHLESKDNIFSSSSTEILTESSNSQTQSNTFGPSPLAPSSLNFSKIALDQNKENKSTFDSNEVLHLSKLTRPWNNSLGEMMNKKSQQDQPFQQIQLLEQGQPSNPITRQEQPFQQPLRLSHDKSPKLSQHFQHYQHRTHDHQLQEDKRLQQDHQKQQVVATGTRYRNLKDFTDQGTHSRFRKILPKDQRSLQDQQWLKDKRLMSNKQPQGNQQSNQNQHFQSATQMNQIQSESMSRVAHERCENTTNRGQPETVKITQTYSKQNPKHPSKQNPKHLDASQHNYSNFGIARLLGTEAHSNVYKTNDTATVAEDSSRQTSPCSKVNETNRFTKSTKNSSKKYSQEHSSQTSQTKQGQEGILERKTVSSASKSGETNYSGYSQTTAIGSLGIEAKAVKLHTNSRIGLVCGVLPLSETSCCSHREVEMHHGDSCVKGIISDNSLQISETKETNQVISEANNNNKAFSTLDLFDDRSGKSTELDKTGSKRKVKVIKRRKSICVSSSKTVHLKPKDIGEPHSTLREFEQQAGFNKRLSLGDEDKISRKRKSMFLSGRPQKVSRLKHNEKDLDIASCSSNPSKFLMRQKSTGRKYQISEITKGSNEKAERKERKVVIIDLFPENEKRPDTEETCKRDSNMNPANNAQKDQASNETEMKRPSRKDNFEEVTDSSNHPHDRNREDHSALNDQTDVLSLMITNVTSLSETAKKLWASSAVDEDGDLADDYKHRRTADGSEKLMDLLTCSSGPIDFSSRREVYYNDDCLIPSELGPTTTSIEEENCPVHDKQGDTVNVSYTSTEITDLSVNTADETNIRGAQDLSPQYSEYRQFQNPRNLNIFQDQTVFSCKHVSEHTEVSKVQAVDQSAQTCSSSATRRVGAHVQVDDCIHKENPEVISSVNMVFCSSDMSVMMYSYQLDERQARREKVESLIPSQIDTFDNEKLEVDVTDTDVFATHSDDAKLQSVFNLSTKDTNANKPGFVNCNTEGLTNLVTTNETVIENIDSCHDTSDSEILNEKCVWIPLSLRC